MVADIFYPILTLKITVLVCFIQKKFGGLTPRQSITLDPLVGLQLPHTLSCKQKTKKKRCVHIFSGLSPDDLS